MRKIESKVVRAFIWHRPAHEGNTHTDGYNLYLHGNKIAKYEDGHYWFNLCGWNTPTTRSRINALFDLLNKRHRVHQIAWELYLDGEPINSSQWYKIA